MLNLTFRKYARDYIVNCGMGNIVRWIFWKVFKMKPIRARGFHVERTKFNMTK